MKHGLFSLPQDPYMPFSLHPYAAGTHFKQANKQLIGSITNKSNSIYLSVLFPLLNNVFKNFLSVASISGLFLFISGSNLIFQQYTTVCLFILLWINMQAVSCFWLLSTNPRYEHPCIQIFLWICLHFHQDWNYSVIKLIHVNFYKNLMNCYDPVWQFLPFIWSPFIFIAITAPFNLIHYSGV